ncbi:hypothetical protein [Zhenhengia yiwuensis]|uniref:Uncharacterized protein n=1 Tax=Zhenhengia yiwuensis TaxID=2763666 RepID=A0A926ENM0_9FIRM|nr:hypothetical protein [Zhenhengia yiwuensis]MBC8581730.1 hypothetical protein [Zhenhengia yiwuensis]
MNDILESSPYFSQQTNYWIVRSGVESKFFEEFERNEQIALGWNLVKDLKSIENKCDIDAIRDLVEFKYNPLLEELSNKKNVNIKRRISDITGKINRFVNELKIGDIILTPGKEEVLIGEVLSDTFIEEGSYKNSSGSLEETIIGDLNKVRDVKWIKKIPRDELEPNLRLILNVNHGIAHINNDQVITEINRTLYSFYVTDEKGHSIFRIKTQNEIDFDKYALFIRHAHGLYNILKNDLDEEKLTIKTNIQSPGPIEFIGNAVLVGEMSIGLLCMFKKNKEALDKLDSSKQEKIKNYIDTNPVEDDLPDYEFPYEGEF